MRYHFGVGWRHNEKLTNSMQILSSILKNILLFSKNFYLLKQFKIKFMNDILSRKYDVHHFVQLKLEKNHFRFFIENKK